MHYPPCWLQQKISEFVNDSFEREKHLLGACNCHKHEVFDQSKGRNGATKKFRSGVKIWRNVSVHISDGVDMYRSYTQTFTAFFEVNLLYSQKTLGTKKNNKNRAVSWCLNLAAIGVTQELRLAYPVNIDISARI